MKSIGYHRAEIIVLADYLLQARAEGISCGYNKTQLDRIIERILNRANKEEGR